MWEAYTRKQKCIENGQQIIDEDFKSDDDDETQGYWVNQQPEYRDRQEGPPLVQQRGIGLDVDMIGSSE